MACGAVRTENPATLARQPKSTSSLNNARFGSRPPRSSNVFLRANIAAVLTDKTSVG